MKTPDDLFDRLYAALYEDEDVEEKHRRLKELGIDIEGVIDALMDIIRTTERRISQVCPACGLRVDTIDWCCGDYEQAVRATGCHVPFSQDVPSETRNTVFEFLRGESDG